MSGERSRDSVIVSTEWLAANLRDPRLRIVDIRGKVLPPASAGSREARERTQTQGSEPRYLAKRDDYEAGHVPGAVFVDWTRDIVDPDDPVPVQVAGPTAFATKMGELGIGDDDLVVAYDDYDHIFAGRLAWALRYYGHDAVRLLDGGFSRWNAEKRPISREIPEPVRANFTPRVHPELRRSADEVAAAAGRPDVLLVDARPADQYEGLASAARRAGHIPGAVNVPYARLVDASTGKFLPKGELGRVFAESGIDVANLPRDVVVYCNGGVSCTLTLHALQILGRDDVAVYDGSWNEWGNDERRPIATGKSGR